ncbi:MAG: biotin--[acetyl-CoA-carboxylase] ligase [Spirochaetaceae bacterium]
MNVERLTRDLAGRPLRYYESVDSTNAAARAWLKSEDRPPDGALVVADEQTAGRGRFGRRWETPPGTAVALSLIVQSDSPVGLPQAAGVAVATAIQPLVDGAVRLKWPNDVEIDGRKVAGILIEQQPVAGSAFYVVGIGINVDLDFAALAGAPRELSLRATSIARHMRGPSSAAAVDRAELVCAVTRQFDRWRSAADLQQRWKALLSTLGRRISVQGRDGVISGPATDVDEFGALRIEDERRNRTVTVGAGDVTVIDGGFSQLE